MKFAMDQWVEAECELTVPKVASHAAMELMNRNPDSLEPKEKRRLLVCRENAKGLARHYVVGQFKLAVGDLAIVEVKGERVHVPLKALRKTERPDKGGRISRLAPTGVVDPEVAPI